MLKATGPDVVHISTPPQSHYSLARKCLEAGKHVYLEKPFTVYANEAKLLLDLAAERGLKLTVGHNYQFTPEMLEMRRLVGEGFLGGKPVHLESHWSYDLGDSSYVGAFLGSGSHWLRQLPGRLFHNLISHGIAKLAEFLEDDLVEIVARGHQSERLQRLGGGEVFDELRVLIRDKAGTTAFFCFSTQGKPGRTCLRVCGPANSLVADYTSASLVRERGRAYKSYLTFFVPPLLGAREHLRNARRNVAGFLGQRLYHDSGMKELIERFYKHIRTGAPAPIPHREILLTARIMDEIFAQVYPIKASPSMRGSESELREGFLTVQQAEGASASVPVSQ
jgi:predicted dehydrogenase